MWPHQIISRWVGVVAAMDHEGPARSTKLSKRQILLLLAMGIPPILHLAMIYNTVRV